MSDSSNTTAPPSAQAALDADVDAHAAAVLKPEPITLGPHTFHVAPMKVRQVFPFLKLARPLFAALVKRPSSPPAALPPSMVGPGQGSDLPPAAVALTGAELEAALGDAEFILDLLEEHGPGVVKALAVGITTDLAKVPDTETTIGDLELVDLVVLLKHFVVVNASFFAERGLSLPPGLALGEVGAAIAPAPAATRA